MFELVAATRNRHKVEEFKALLGVKADLGTLKSLLDFPGCPEVIEDGDTFEANAEKKALAVSAFTGSPAFADDSGLVVDALNGEPGVRSARYAGDHATDADRIAKLLVNMEGKTDRKARFVCVISVAFNGEVLQSFTGVCEGTIADAPRGDHGFGYDPVFIPSGSTRTFAELGDDEKNKISHRAKAVAAAVEFFEGLSSFIGN